MKLRAIIGSALALTFGLCSAASAADYYPPERMQCHLQGSNKLVCEEFNHQYLVEDTYAGHLTSKHETFLFSYGTAYFTPGMSESIVYYTYKSAYGKLVKIKSVNATIRPDINVGNWHRKNANSDDIYECNAGYMNCPITNLPSVHH